MPTRIVWLTLLAAKDKEGFARFASIENLARRAVVTEEEADRAVMILEAPDMRSSNPDHEGRRIERVPGGWMVLNAKLYDDMVRREDERKATRERVRRHRIKKGDEAPADEPPVTAIATDDLSGKFENLAYRAAYLSARSAVRVPASFDATLQSINVAMTGGPAYDWPVIGQAILEIQSSPLGNVTANALRAFCKSITTKKTGDSGNSADNLVAALEEEYGTHAE